MGLRGPLPDPASSREGRRQKEAVKARRAAGPSKRGAAHPVKAPRAPAGLGKEGRDVWAAAWAEAWMQHGDTGAVERLARGADEAGRLRAALAEHGEVLRKPICTSRGEVVGDEHYENPALASLRKLGVEQLGLLKELGLTPASRARLRLPLIETEPVPDALDELNEKRERRLATERSRGSA